jgi:hypothetical protein
VTAIVRPHISAEGLDRLNKLYVKYVYTLEGTFYVKIKELINILCDEPLDDKELPAFRRWCVDNELILRETAEAAEAAEKVKQWEYNPLSLEDKIEALRRAKATWEIDYKEHGVEHCHCCRLAMSEDDEYVPKENAYHMFFHVLNDDQRFQACTQRCLIGAVNGKKGCMGTPYDAWSEAREQLVEAEEKQSDIEEADILLRRRAKEMTNWMDLLLSEKEAELEYLKTFEEE